MAGEEIVRTTINIALLLIQRTLANVGGMQEEKNKYINTEIVKS